MADDWGINDPVVPTTPDNAGDWGNNDPLAGESAVQGMYFSPKTATDSQVGRLALAGNKQAQATAYDRAINGSAIGRILNAFKVGAEQDWGPEDLGLSEASKNALAGNIWPDEHANPLTVFQAFNKMTMEPAAVGLDALIRGVHAASVGGVQALGQAGAEIGLFGEDPYGFEQDRFNRANSLMAESAGIVAGLNPETVQRTINFAKDTFRRLDKVPFEAGPAMTDYPIDELVGATDSEYFGTKRTPGYDTWAVGPDENGQLTLPLRVPSDAELAHKLPPVFEKGGVNLKYISSPDDVRQVLEEIGQTSGGDNILGRGKMTFRQIEDLAQFVDPEDVVFKRSIGQNMNAEQGLRARQFLVQAATDSKEVAKRIRAGDNSDATLLEWMEKQQKAVMVYDGVKGIQTEQARATAANKILARDVRFAKETVEEGGRIVGDLDDATRDAIIVMANRVATLDEAQIHRYAAQLRRPGFMDYAETLYINALLSSPDTHVANLIGNTIAATLQPVESTVAGVIGTVRRAVTGSKEGAYIGQGAAEVYGMVEAWPDALKAAARGFYTNQPTIGTQKIEYGTFAHLGGPVGASATVPTRALLAADEYWKTLAVRANLYSQAYASAAKRGVSTDKLARDIQLTMSRPTPKMLKAAEDQADYQTFTRRLGKKGQAIQRVISDTPGGKFVVPFMRTPTNIIKYTVERTPFAPLMKETRDALMGRLGAAAQDQAIARMLVGSSAIGTGITLAAKGLLTGSGPRDPRERALWLQSNQPYSIKYDGNWYPLSRFSPASDMLALAADAYQLKDYMTPDDASTFMGMAAYAFGNDVLDKTWLSPVTDLYEAVTNPERNGAYWLKGMAGSLVPGAVAKAAKVNDPYVRAASSVLDAIQARVSKNRLGIPSSVDLPKQYDTWGQPLMRPEIIGPGAIGKFLSPFTRVPVHEDPVSKELLRLGYFPAKLDNKIRGVELTNQQYEDYQKLAGRLAKMVLMKNMQSSRYATWTDGEKAAVNRKLMSAARQSAQNYILTKYPQIMRDAAKAKLESLQ